MSRQPMRASFQALPTLFNSTVIPSCWMECDTAWATVTCGNVFRPTVRERGPRLNRRNRSFSGLARTDALAAQLIARAAPLMFSVAQSPAEREAVYRLRYSIVVEKGWARPEDFPDG